MSEEYPRIAFERAKEVVLVAAFDQLYYKADYDTFTVELVYEATKSLFSRGFLQRAMTSLVSNGWLESYSESDDYATQYSLTDKGVERAEGLPPLSQYLTDLLREPGSVWVPASDRVVTLTHNQVTQAEKQIQPLVEALEKSNGHPEEEGLRERLLGQIKAGRELIRSGQYKAYLLIEVLSNALNEIIKRYSDETIKALANALLGAIIAKLLG